MSLNRGMKLLPKQQQLLESNAFIRASLGAWGSGKTTGAVLAFLRCCFENPYDPDVHGEDRPFSIICGVSMRVVKDSSWRELKRLVPPELIIREWKSPDPAIELANGHLCKAYSVKGSMEGASCHAVLVDECHMLPDEKVWMNYQARARDPRGRSHVALMSGIPVDGWMRRLLDKPGDENRLVVYSSMEDNVYLPPHVAREMRKSVSKGDADTMLGGRWRKMQGVCLHSFDEGLHIVADPGDRSRPVSLSCDIGDKGVILFVQEKERRIKTAGAVESVPGIHIVDEMLPDKITVEQAMREAKGRGWRIDPRVSVILIDPTSRRDEIEAIRSVFGSQIQIIRRKRGDVREQVEYGIDCVNTAFCDADDNVRLTLSRALPREKRSLRNALNQYHRNPKTGYVIKDETSDHACDALRYAVVHFMPLARGGHQVFSRR